MKIYVKNKLLSLSEGSYVLNENKESVLMVKGKVFSITRKKFIYSLDGKLLFMVRNKFFRFIKKYSLIYNSDHHLVAKIRNKSMLHNSFKIIEGNDEFVIQGEFLKRNYEIIKNGQLIGRLQRNLQIIADTFEIEVFNENDIPFIVSLIIAIDNVTDHKSHYQ